LSTPLLAAVGLVYFYVACEQWWKGNTAGFALFMNYGCANIALIWYMK
jgi:hypothetical protein